MSETVISYLKLAIAALLPVVAAAITYFLQGRTKLSKLPYMVKQVMIGIVFGALAVVGTEWGIPMNGAQVNCRDGAVLVAGLMFGGPAGIIAGLIGGIERYIAVAWGVGTFTRIACSVSTVIAGLYSAALRKWMFEDKKPGWALSLAIGIVMEIFHLTMVFITNMAEPERAMAVVKACTFPMVIANGLSVMIAAIVLTLIAKEPFLVDRKSGMHISQNIQRWLLLTVVVAFVLTSFFVFRLQDEIASSQTESLLTHAIEDVADDVELASDRNLLSIAKKIAVELKSNDLLTLAEKYNLAEISIIDRRGVIVSSTDPSYVGYNMWNLGDQASDFMDNIQLNKEYVQEYGPISSDSNIYRKYAGVNGDSGIIQVGLDAERFQAQIDEEIVGITQNRHVGNTGYIIILNRNFKAVSVPKDFKMINFKEALEGKMEEEGIVFESTDPDGNPTYSKYITREGYYIISVLPKDEALQLRNVALYVNAFMEILVFAILFAIIYFLIKRVVVNRLKRVNNSLSKITDGNLDETVNVRSTVEFASLSDDINQTVDTLKHYIAEASARIDKELEFAKSIQSSALPSIFPAFPKRKDFDIFASMDPAKEVGGDFYDFYMTGTDTLNFLIADVSGKGIPAAMFMMRAKTELKSLTEAGMPMSDVFTNGNHELCEGNDAGMFVTAWQGGIDLRTGKVTFANAGHNPPLVKHGSAPFEYLRSKVGFVLAGMDGVMYKAQEVQLEPGDIIYLYTDGVTEATNASEELYGEERLLAAINSKEFADMNELCKFIKADADAFVGDAPQFDDMTMVALKYIGTPKAPEISFENATLDDINAVTEFVEAELEKIDCPMKTVIQFNIAVDEIFSNIVRYGYKGTTGPINVKLEVKDDPKMVYMHFTDSGIPYNPLIKEDPDVTLSAEERQIGGLGIFMVKKSMDDISYRYEGDQNILTIGKKIG